MLRRHDSVTRSNHVAALSRRVRALEVAISTSALQAAAALRVPHPEPPADGGLTTYELRQLLQALRAEGLVLPVDVELLAPDRRW
jgi:hypothetical protein